MSQQAVLRAIFALTILAAATPALAQECTLEPAVGARVIDVVYVPNRLDHTVSVVDVTPGSACYNQVVDTFGVSNGSPTAVVSSADGKRAYTLNSNHDAVGVIDTRTSTMLYEIPLGVVSGGLALATHPALDRVYVSNLLAGTVTVIDTTTDTVIANVPLDDPGFVLGDFPPPLTGFEISFPAEETFPIGLAVTPDASELWVAVEFPGMITIIDTATNTVSGHLHFDRVSPDDYFPPLAVDVAFSGSGASTTAHVVALGRDDIEFFPGVDVDFPDVLYRIDVATRTITQTLVGDGINGLGPGAAELTVASTGDTWISNSGILDPLLNIPVPPYTTAATVVTPGLATSTRETAGNSPVGVAKSPAGDYVYIVNYTSGSLAIFDADSGAPPTVLTVGNGPVTPRAFTIPALPTPPAFTGPCGQTLSVAAGDLLEFTVGASTVALDGEDGLTLTAAGLPVAAVMSPLLPVVGTDGIASDFSWTPVPEDFGSHAMTFSAAGELVTTQCEVTIDVTPPSDDVPFSVFLIAKLHIDGRWAHKGSFDFQGLFRLGNASDGADPESEDVTIAFDDFTLTIPAGSFGERGRNNFKFSGVVDGVRINAHLHGWRGFHGRRQWWTFKFTGKYADLTGVDNPVDTKLQVGDDVGQQPRWARIKG